MVWFDNQWDGHNDGCSLMSNCVEFEVQTSFFENDVRSSCGLDNLFNCLHCTQSKQNKYSKSRTNEKNIKSLDNKAAKNEKIT